ncbi:hypothetical protein CFC21_075527 [Triticum aestivum]|uniref:Uncharacterized protein n=2 Tax=Triticum aestivum TaxID=4565 RepID=A0A3B6MJJ0_WHEAT|nr:hypothetical protein CFC21_075527 [Triticum aestivum]
MLGRLLWLRLCSMSPKKRLCSMNPQYRRILIYYCGSMSLPIVFFETEAVYCGLYTQCWSPY